MKKNHLIALAMAFLGLTASCQKDPKAPVNEEELITTLILSLQKDGSPTTEQFAFNDPDGDGGITATIDSIILDKAATYHARITLLNASVTPADTISNEVLEEGTVHQFFYVSDPSTILSGFTYSGENDTNGYPIGLDFSFDTRNSVGSGSLKIILRHQPDKTAAGVSNGDITNAGGETDIEIEFPVRLQ